MRAIHGAAFAAGLGLLALGGLALYLGRSPEATSGSPGPSTSPQPPAVPAALPEAPSWREEAPAEAIRKLPTATLRFEVVRQTDASPVAAARIRLNEPTDRRQWSAFAAWIDDDPYAYQGRDGFLVAWDRVAKWTSSLELATDEHGRASVEVPANLELSFDVYGPDPETIGRLRRVPVPTLGEGEQRTMTIRLPVGQDLEFWARVVADADGRPLAGARASLFEDGDATVASVTDANGFIHLTTRSWTTPHLQISEPGFGLQFVPVAPGHATAEQSQEVRLLATGTVFGGVTGPDGAPADGILVTASADAESLGWKAGWLASHLPVEWSTTTSGGDFRLDALPAAVPLHLQFAWPGDVRKLEEAVVLAPGEERRLDYSAVALARIRGRILDQEGVPVRNTSVSLVSEDGFLSLDMTADILHYVVSAMPGGTRMTTSDENGTFSFVDVSRGNYLVGVSSGVAGPGGFIAESEVSPTGVPVRVTGTEAELEVTVRVARGLFIRGTLVDPNGAPVAGFPVVAMPMPGAGFVMTNSDDDGRFALGPLWPGPHQVQCFLPQGMLEPAMRLRSSEPIMAEAGAEGIVLRLTRGTAVQGSVFQRTAPAAGVEVIALSQNARRLSTTTDPSGFFAFQGLEANHYLIYAVSADAIAMLPGVQVTEGKNVEGLVLTLQPAARVHVRTSRGFDGMSCSAAADFGFLDWKPIAPGGSVDFVLPAGEVTLTLRNEREYLARRTLLLEAATVQEVVLE
ncbi:MAG: carboxypeptidase regulatory-like domain-containing protein [Planctomycetota bacterium]|nr:MAG: carboxypeptidase regulatory-like domain-containing protein [Planctomycetota bacterium]